MVVTVFSFGGRVNGSSGTLITYPDVVVSITFCVVVISILGFVGRVKGSSGISITYPAVVSTRFSVVVFFSYSSGVEVTDMEVDNFVVGNEDEGVNVVVSIVVGAIQQSEDY